jgi:hypothetical protein
MPRRLRVRFRGFTTTGAVGAFSLAGQSAALGVQGGVINASFTLAASNLDATTLAAYNAAITTAERAAIVVAALTGTVVCEIVDAVGVVRASGTMASPWATASGATVTVGEVDAQGISVTSGGTPDSNWYCQFRSGSRFVRGTFGVLSSGRDFVWSLVSFSTGSRGTLGTVVVTAQGVSDGGSVPGLLSVPVITAWRGTTTSVGSVLQVTPGVWQNEPPVERSGTVGAFTSTSIDLDAGANSTPGYYVGMFVVTGPFNLFAQPWAVITGYDATLKRVTHAGWLDDTPVVGRAWRIVTDFPLVRSWQWRRNGVAIPGEIASTYTAQNADAGAAITVTETVGRISRANTGAVFEVPADPVSATSSAVVIGAGATAAGLLYQSDLSYIGSFRAPDAGVSGNRTLASFAGGSIAVKKGSTPTLLVRGHINTTAVAEVGLNVTPTAAAFASLPTAPLVTPASAGTNLPVLDAGVNMGTIGVEDGKGADSTLHPIGGGHMLFSRVAWLDNGPLMHFRRPLDITDQNAANVEGPFVVVDPTYQTNTRWTTGWYCDVPTEWQSTLGGDVLVGHGSPYVSISVNNQISHGPSAAVISTGDITATLTRKHTGSLQAVTTSPFTVQLASGASATPGFYVGDFINFPASDMRALRITAYNGTTKVATLEALPSGASPPSPGATYNTIPALAGRQLVGYSPSDPLQPSLNGYGNFLPIWNFGAAVGGMCIPEGSNTLLVFVKVGDGMYQYAQRGLTTQPSGVQANAQRLYDPFNSGAGVHTFPNFYKVLAYDLNELAQVRANTRTFNSVKPYGVFTLDIPAVISSNMRSLLRGVAYNPADQRIYVCEVSGTNAAPVIHTFGVTVGPTVVTAPTVTAYTGTLSGVGGILRGTPAVWENENNYELTGTVASGDLVSAGNLRLTGGSSVNGAYVGWYVGHDSMDEPPYLAGVSRATVTAYSGTTKVATVNWTTPNASPPVGANWWLYQGYPLIRSWQWKRNGVAIPGATDLIYTKSNADIGASITFTETAGSISVTNNGSVKEIPSVTSTAVSAPIVVIGSVLGGNEITSGADFDYVGWFKLDPYFGKALGSIGASQSATGSKTFVVTSGSIAGQRRAIEVTFPTPSTSTSYASIPSATKVRPSGDFALPWESQDTGAITGIAASNGYEPRGICQIPGTSTLVMSFAEVYSITQGRAMFATRQVDMSTNTSGTVQLFVPYDPLQPNSRWMSGSIVPIPAGNQSALGGDLLVSGTSLSIHSNLSQGPCAAVINSATFADRLPRTHVGTSTGGTGNTIQLAVGANETDNYYVNCFLNVGGVQLRRITGYVGSTRTATVEGTGLPTGSNLYRVIPGVVAKQVVGYRHGIDIFGSTDSRGFAALWNSVYSSILGAAIVRNTGSAIVVANPHNGRMDYGFSNGALPNNGTVDGGASTKSKWRLYNPYNLGGPGDNLSGMYLVDGGVLRLWVYSVADLATVAAGSANFYGLTPKAGFSLRLPADAQIVFGVTFDNDTGRLYVVLDLGIDLSQPAVVVYQCNKWS